jgi:hypothetical protein
VNLVVITPIYKPFLTTDEVQALIHLMHYLPNVPKAFVCPHHLHFTSSFFTREPFDDAYFLDIAGYNRLMLSDEFYQRFAAYDYLLIVQLDALVLSDQISTFLEMPIDYIGAPWFRDEARPERGFLGAGNGGLSLRRTTAFLKTLKEAKLTLVQAVSLLLDVQERWMMDLKRDSLPIRLLKKLNFIRKTWLRGQDFIERFEWNEDYFWALRAPFLVDCFRVADVEQSLCFAFEMHPRHCFSRAGGRLPFGCHAWTKYDREFWEPYLLPKEATPAALDEIISFVDSKRE